MLLSLNAYVLTGGADFGGGVWDFLAFGPRAGRQRRLIAEVIAPIWEANHVWLIVVIVLFFTAFPTAFAAVAVALHIPLTAMLIGIVLRGSAFIFRSLTRTDDRAYQRWSRVFAVASAITPVMLGVIVGTVASGRVRLARPPDFFGPWLKPFPFAVGFFTLFLFAYLAAVYLTLEAPDPDLRGDFRRRAWLALALSAGAAVACLALAEAGAPPVFNSLRQAGWSKPLVALTSALAIGSAAALWKERYAWARVLAGATATGVLWGWALSQHPYVVVPDLTFAAAAAPASVLRPVLALLLVGAIIVAPAFACLYTVFNPRWPPRRHKSDPLTG